MDINSLLIITIILVAAVLIAVGVYLILVLNETRQSLRNLNRIFSHTESILSVMDEKIIQPTGSILGILTVVKEMAEIFVNFKKDKQNRGRNGD